MRGTGINTEAPRISFCQKMTQYNITLTNNVTGNMGDRSNQFAFSGAISDNGRYIYASKGSAPTATNANKIEDSGSGTSISTTLAHGETYYISGLSSDALVSYTETNNTQDTYSVSITGGTASAASAVAPSGTKSMAQSPITGSTNNASAVTFTNNLDSVSPTGVVLRYGPYIGMLAIAAALIVFARRRKAEGEE